MRSLTTMLTTMAAGAAFLLPVAIMGEALAQPAECLNFAQIEETAERLGDTIAHDIRGDDAIEFIALLNAVPPPTTFMGDQVVIITNAPGPATGGAPRAFVMILLVDCVVADGTLTHQLLNQLIDGVLGVDADGGPEA